MGADEAGTLRRLTGLRRDFLEPLINEHRGRVVKLMGDGLLVEFASVVDAVACALAWQDGVAGRDPDIGENKRLQFRIGINLGDVIVEGDDIHGDGVNIATRLEGLADPGGICISGDAYRQAKGKTEAAFENLGDHNLKNVAEPMRVYRVVLEQSNTSPSYPPSGPLPIPDKPSIAVLPFTNMSGDPEQEYFSDGVTEDIITELSRFRGLFVIARNSSFSYRDKSLDLREVAKELGVRYLLEGSVRRSGQRIRVTAQLIEGLAGSHVWAERYDRNIEDIFDLQDEITRDVVGAIAPQIELAEISRVRVIRSASVTAYDLALKAQALFYESIQAGDPQLYAQSVAAATEALKLDSRSPHALWIQAFVYAIQYLYRWHRDPDKALEQAWRTANRLLELDSSDPRGYSVRGVVNQFRGDFDAALADFHRSFSLNPNFAWNIFLMAWCESLAGKMEEAKKHAELALRMSPRDAEIWLGDAYLALLQAYFAEGDFDEAAKWGELAIQMTPKAPIRRALMIVCCNRAGKSDEAAHHAEVLQSFAPDFIPSILNGDLTLYKLSEHNKLLIEGLKAAGFGAQCADGSGC
jgi:TolB-like protein/Tfp pilus assembly protein PilF